MSIHLQNYQISSYIIRTVKQFASDHPLAPNPHEIPELLGSRLDSLPIDCLLPVQELLGDKVVLEWGIMALSDVTLEAKECEFQIRQPTAAYFRESIELNRDEVVPTLTAVLEAWNSRVATHFALLDRLNDLAKHLMTKRPWTIGGYYTMSKRSGIKKIVNEMKEGYANVVKVHDDTEPTLRRGGGGTQ